MTSASNTLPTRAWIHVDDRTRRIFDIVSFVVLIGLSGILIGTIVADSFNKTPFYGDAGFMHFQLAVCLIFTLQYWLSVAISANPWQKAASNIFFLLVSIPYTNILQWCDVYMSQDVLYYLRFIPVLRGAAGVALALSYVSRVRIFSMFASYLGIIIIAVFFASIIFYDRESQLNPYTRSYEMSLWWCCLELTTLGAPVDPVTPIGRMLSVMLSVMGMLMFPLFTVYLTSLIKRVVTINRRPVIKLKPTHKSHPDDACKDGDRCPGHK